MSGHVFISDYYITQHWLSTSVLFHNYQSLLFNRFFPIKLLGYFLQCKSLCFHLLPLLSENNKALNLAFSFCSFCRVCCPEPGVRARDPPAGELPCSRMWSLQQNQSQTTAGDSRLPRSTLTHSPPTPSSSSRPHSREITERGHTGMSKLLRCCCFVKYTFVF